MKTKDQERVTLDQGLLMAKKKKNKIKKPEKKRKNKKAKLKPTPMKNQTKTMKKIIINTKVVVAKGFSIYFNIITIFI